MHQHAVDICVIEDDAAQRRLLTERLRGCGYRVVEADSGPSGLHAVYQHRPRVVICDVLLPELSGIQVCRHVRADPTLDGTYVLLLTAHDHTGRKQTALDAGADDYLQKPYDFRELKARIRSGMRYHRLQERLRRAALTDGLTEVWNHSQFRELLDREFSRARRYGGVLSLVMVDLDHFKAINDTFGHETGNQVLKQTAQHLRRGVREVDTVTRYGGEEFAIICPETPLAEAARLGERLRRSLPENVRVANHPELHVLASFGVASTEDPRVNAVADLITLADQALYKSKRDGRNRVTRSDQVDPMPQDTPSIRMDEIDRLRKEVYALTIQTKELCLQSVWALIQALEARDGYSAWHSRNVTLYTRWLVDAANWSEPLRLAATNAAMLHDIGKIGIPDELLMRPRPLNPEELATLRQVPLITCKILEPLRVFETEIQMIRHLRENYDGSGYPDGLSGSAIPIGSRLLAVAEAFDSLTCNRAYRPGHTVEEAVELIMRDANRQFDPQFTVLLRTDIAQHTDRWKRQIDRTRQELPDVEAGCCVRR